MEDDEQSPATETITTLEFYQALSNVCDAGNCTLNIPVGSEDYWDLVLRTPDLDPQEENVQEDLVFNGSRFNSSDDDLLDTDNSSDRRLSSATHGTSGLTKVKDITNSRSFGVGSNGFSYNFEAGRLTRSGVPVAAYSEFTAKGTGSFTAAASVGVATVSVTFSCGGEADGWRREGFCSPMENHMYQNREIYMDTICECTVYSHIFALSTIS